MSPQKKYQVQVSLLAELISLDPTIQEPFAEHQVGQWKLDPGRGRVLLLPGRTEWVNPFDWYFQSTNEKKPHSEFVELASDPTPEKVLEFVNKWGLPRPGLTHIVDIVAEAVLLNSIVNRLALLKRPSPEGLKELREHVACAAPFKHDLIFKGLSRDQISEVCAAPQRPKKVSDHRMSEDEKKASDIIHRISEDGAKELGLAWISDDEAKEGEYAALWDQRAADILRDKRRIPDEKILDLAWRDVLSDLNGHLMNTRSVTVREGESVKFIHLSRDFLTAMGVMIALDLTKGRGPRKCRRPNCSRVFIPQRPDQIYHNECAKMEAERARYWRKKAFKMHEHGLSFRQISDQLGIDVQILTEWSRKRDKVKGKQIRKTKWGKDGKDQEAPMKTNKGRKS